MQIDYYASLFFTLKITYLIAVPYFFKTWKMYVITHRIDLII